MPDTQWPRFEVFVQEKPGKPHLDYGSVHAADIELALLNARDVFVRRPECNSLWVAPVPAIYSRTREELESGEAGETSPASDHLQKYRIFYKPKPAGTQTYQDTLEASSPQQALALALQTLAPQRPPDAWWVIPDEAFVESEPQDSESFFSPALDKRFRMSTDFHVVTAMRQMRAGEAHPADNEHRNRKE